MLKPYCKYMALIVLFILVLVPSLKVPMLSDDYYYSHFIGSSLSTQYQHYIEWSGRIVTNIISGYMMNWVPHHIYEGLTALALSLMIFFYASIPSVMEKKEINPHWSVVLILFVFYWIVNPALGETSFWFVGAANYVWPNFFVSLYIIMLIRTKENKSVLSLVGCFIIGFLGGCSNENTSVVVLLITLAYVSFYKNLKNTYPYLLGFVTGLSVLIFSPGGAIRSKLFVGWHELSLLGKIDEQLFTRMPEAMKTYWILYIVIIILAMTVSLLNVKNKRPLVYSLIFFVASIAANMAFIASPYMPPRAGNGALCLALISTSFLISVVLNEAEKWQKIACVSFVIISGIVYFVPSYTMFVYAVDRAWEQNKIRHKMIADQLSVGVKDIVIPDLYFTRLLKSGDGYPAYKAPAIKDFYRVNSFYETPVSFDYSSLTNQKYISANVGLLDGITLLGIYLYQEPFSEKKLIIYRSSGDINMAFKRGIALLSHLEVIGSDGVSSRLNKDTANPAVYISGSWYTFSDAQGIDFDKIKSINIGMYSVNPYDLKSEHIINVM